jgi:hypothetical protein
VHLDSEHPVIRALRQRGFVPVRWNPSPRLFLPPKMTPEQRSRILVLWRDYGFRLLTRDLLHKSGRARLSDLQKFCSPEATEKFLGELVALGLVEKVGPRSYACLVGDSGSFGVTLEWYLSEMLEAEFAASSLWGVRISGPGPGDFDVLAKLGHRLLYVEAKSSPPKHIHQSEVEAFWKRLLGLQPDVAIYFVDTHLRMKDKIVVLFEEALRSYALAGKESDASVERLHGEIFHIGKRVFLTNSHRSIEANFRRCFQHAQPSIYGLRIQR